MSVEITSIQFTDQYTGASATKNDFVLGSIGDRIIAYVDISIHWESLAVLCSFNSATKTITRSDNRSWLADGFRANDTFDIVNGGANTGSFTIVSVNATEIVTVEALTTATSSGVDFRGTTPVTSFDFYFNYIENKATVDFTSLTDAGTLIKMSAYKAVWNNGDSVALTASSISKGWDTGIAGTVSKIDVSGYDQRFQVAHGYIISPIFLTGQQNSFDSDPLIPPPYFRGDNCLKYVCRVDAKFQQNSPQIVHSTDFNFPFQYGNTGWFNEFLNGGTPEYSLVSVAYQDVVSGDSVTNPDFNRTTLVTMVINSVTGNFTNVAGMTPGSQFVVHMAYAPQDQADYINTNTDMFDNFRYDSKLTTVGAASVNGAQFGTDAQTLTGIVGTFNSANQITVTFTIDLATAYKDFLKTKSEQNWNYLFWVTPQKLASTYMGDTDRNAVLGDFNSFIYDKDDNTLLTWSDILFYQLPDTTTNPYTDYNGFIGDQVLTSVDFLILQNATPIQLNLAIQAVNTVTGASFNLQTYNTSFISKETSDGIICEDFTTVQPYKLASDDPYNQITFDRNEALDTVSQYGYTFKYGFMLRYETWRDLPDFNTAFQCDHTQKWSIYSLATNWQIQYQISIDVLNVAGDNPTTFIRTANLEIGDETTGYVNGSGISSVIDTYVTQGMSYVSIEKMIAEDGDTHVIATFTGDFSAFPAGYDSYYGYLALDIRNIGGETFLDKTTTEGYPLEESVWIGEAVLTVVDATTITIEGDIDYTKIDNQINEYILSARLGYKNNS